MLKINNSYSVLLAHELIPIRLLWKPACNQLQYHHFFTVSLQLAYRQQAHVASSKIAWLSRNITGSPSLQLKFFPWPHLESYPSSSMYTEHHSLNDKEMLTNTACWYGKVHVHKFQRQKINKNKPKKNHWLKNRTWLIFLIRRNTDTLANSFFFRHMKHMQIFQYLIGVVIYVGWLCLRDLKDLP